MKKLRESGYIEMDKDGFISLLPSGEEIARRIYERHKLLTSFSSGWASTRRWLRRTPARWSTT